MGRLSVFIINYNGASTVLETIRSILESDGVDTDVQVLDDVSTDDSVARIRSAYPGIPIHVQPHNTGRPNVLRNLATRMATTPRVMITDNDILFDRHCLARLMDCMDEDHQIAACSPRLMYWQEPQRIYRAGTRVHYVGAAICPHRDERIEDAGNVLDAPPELFSGGGILLVDRAAALRLGGFDEAYDFGWGEDGEFYQRLLMAGYRSLYVPTAFALHESKPGVGARRERAPGQIYNRWRFILTHYAVSTIVLVAPALLLYELAQATFMAARGMLGVHVSATLRALGHIGRFRDTRRRIQALRTVPDSRVLFSGTIYVGGSLPSESGFLKTCLAVLNRVLDAWWRGVRLCLP